MFYHIVGFDSIEKGFGFLPHSCSNGLFGVTEKVLFGINYGTGFSHFTLICPWTGLIVLVCIVDTSQRDVIDDGWIIWSDGMIGLFSLCSALDGVLPAHRITLHQVHIVSSLSSMHFIVLLWTRWSAGYKTSFNKCLEMRNLDIEKLFCGGSGSTGGYLSA